MEHSAAARLDRNEKIALFLAPAFCLQWLIVHSLGWNLPAPWQPLLPGLSIFGAAFMLSWAAEVAQLDIPQALSLAFVAIVAVLPEYAVDMYFAWTAGKDPKYVAYAAANMTGGNRLLIGAGWATVVFAYFLKYRHRSITLAPGHRLELLALLAATVYSLVLPLKKTLSWVDSIVFLSIFGVYMVQAARAHSPEPELDDGPAAWMAHKSPLVRRLYTIGLFVVAGLTIFRAAHPFAEGLLESGRHWGVEEFLLVQWLAPLASETPEFMVAILFALRNKPGAGFGTLLSSKVNQWTLLVGMLPLAYAISAGSPQAMHLDSRQVEELFLTSAQSLFAAIILCDMNFSLKDGLVIFVLFAGQFLVVHEAGRMIFAGVYLAIALGLIIFRPHFRHALFKTLREGFHSASHSQIL
jgi:cation:H+ antiporter